MNGKQRRVTVPLLLFLLAGCSGENGGSAPEQDADLAILNVTVLDARDSPPLENATILVRGNRIARVASPGESSPPTNARVYDGRGTFAIPGLWDMHTHALWTPFVEEGFLRLFLVNGVTGIRDMGGTLEVLQAVRPGGSMDSPLNPRIVGAGPWLNEFVIDPRAGIAVGTPQEAREAVASLAAGGVDFIKVYLHLPRDVFLAIVDEAREQGLPVAGHVPIEIGSEEASGLGMRSIEHMRSELGGFCDALTAPACQELFATFRRNRTWQTPTLLVRGNRALLDTPGVAEDSSLRYVPSYLRQEWEDTRAGRLEAESFDELRKRWDAERELAGALHRARVPVLAGSDAGDLYTLAGFSIHRELELLVEAGLSPIEALRAATLSPAEFLGATDSLGTIAEGNVADLVLLDGNPLEDIRNTTKIRAVVRDGRLYDRDALDEILRQIAQAAKP